MSGAWANSKIPDQSVKLYMLIKELTIYFFIFSLRKQAYTENFITKNWNFSNKNSDIFHMSAQNIDNGYSLEPLCRGSSNEYPQSMFFSRNQENYVYPCKSQFYYIKVGFKGIKII